MFSQTCITQPAKGILKKGRIRKVVSENRFNQYQMQCEGKLKLRSHTTSYCLTEVVTKAGLTLHFYLTVLVLSRNDVFERLKHLCIPIFVN
jgi:hypothetical protein